MMMEHYNPSTEPYLNVIYQDEDLLVLNKQAGLLTVPGKGEHLSDCLENRAKETFPGALTVHRLDMDTSGLIVMALNKFAHRHLSLQFQNRNVDKEYIALVYGRVSLEQGVIDLPLICDWPNRPKQMVDHDNGKPSLTNWKVLERYCDRTLMSLVPLTGRSHQLRVHMKELGYPIIGDRFYAPEPVVKLNKRLCLHSRRLQIMHPVLKEKITFENDFVF